MAYKANQATKDYLKEEYEKVCNAYLKELVLSWDLDSSTGYWVGNRIGGVYSYNDTGFISMDNILYCIENDVSCETYEEWADYCLWAREFSKGIPNLSHWCNGCPRVDKAEMQRMSKLKNELTEVTKGFFR